MIANREREQRAREKYEKDASKREKWEAEMRSIEALQHYLDHMDDE